MARIVGGHLTKDQKNRLLVGQLHLVSPPFISALQQLDELSVEPVNVWREGAFRALKNDTSGQCVTTGVLQQTYSSRDHRFVVVTLAEAGGHMELSLHWNDDVEKCMIAPEVAHQIHSWRIKGGPMLLDRLHNTKSLKAA